MSKREIEDEDEDLFQKPRILRGQRSDAQRAREEAEDLRVLRLMALAEHDRELQRGSEPSQPSGVYSSTRARSKRSRGLHEEDPKASKQSRLMVPVTHHTRCAESYAGVFPIDQQDHEDWAQARGWLFAPTDGVEGLKRRYYPEEVRDAFAKSRTRSKELRDTFWDYGPTYPLDDGGLQIFAERWYDDNRQHPDAILHRLFKCLKEGDEIGAIRELKALKGSPPRSKPDHYRGWTVIGGAIWVGSSIALIAHILDSGASLRAPCPPNLPVAFIKIAGDYSTHLVRLLSEHSTSVDVTKGFRLSDRVDCSARMYGTSGDNSLMAAILWQNRLNLDQPAALALFKTLYAMGGAKPSDRYLHSDKDMHRYGGSPQLRQDMFAFVASFDYEVMLAAAQAMRIMGERADAAARLRPIRIPGAEGETPTGGYDRRLFGHALKPWLEDYGTDTEEEEE